MKGGGGHPPWPVKKNTLDSRRGRFFPRPHGQNAGIGRNGNRRLPLLKNPIPRGRTAENGRAATRGMDRKGLKTGGWKDRKGKSEVKKDSAWQCRR
ncbi:hypothetical protein AAH013_21150 [Phocaeicola dorei]|uniref:hypothetical protein n=1 Tax=Bacteroidaceae TaxID=815 RepID=UPI0039B3C94D